MPTPPPPTFEAGPRRCSVALGSSLGFTGPGAGKWGWHPERPGGLVSKGKSVPRQIPGILQASGCPCTIPASLG